MTVQRGKGENGQEGRNWEKGRITQQDGEMVVEVTGKIVGGVRWEEETVFKQERITQQHAAMVVEVPVPRI